MTSITAKMIVMVVLTASLVGIGFAAIQTGEPTIPPAPATNVTNATGGGGILRVATTTSLEDTGLLAAIEDLYEPEYNVDLQFVAQGTGQSLDTARRCDADMVLVHSPSLEEDFVNEGYGINSRCFAYNYFIIVGPQSDPANISGLDPVVAFRTIADAGSNDTSGVTFVSRGDNSGTHNAEIRLWEEAGLNYTSDVQGAPWYQEIGQGMGQTLTFTSEQGGYTLSDKGTFLSYQGNLTLVELVGEGPALLNRYSAIEVNPSMCPDTNVQAANQLVNWIISDEGQQFIGNYGVDQYGEPLFIPLNGTTCAQPEFNCTCTGNLT